MAEQVVDHSSNSGFEQAKELEAALVTSDRPHIRVSESGERQIKFSPEAASILSSSLNEQRVHKPLSELRDEHRESYDHTIRVTKNALALAWINKDLEGFTTEDIRILVEAALLHDIGKIDVPNEVLDKPGRHDDDEREIMSYHTALSIEKARPNFNGDRRILALVELHHQIQPNPTLEPEVAKGVVERLNLNPTEQRKFEKMHQILEAADKYDALISDRIYKPARSLSDTRDIMMKDFSQHNVELKYVYQITDLAPSGARLTPEELKQRRQHEAAENAPEPKELNA